MDRAVLEQPSASREPLVPHAGHPADRDLARCWPFPAFFIAGFWPVPLTLFLVGWVFQFVGHAFEGKSPEFFRLAFSSGRPAVVGRQDARTSLT